MSILNTFFQSIQGFFSGQGRIVRFDRQAQKARTAQDQSNTRGLPAKYEELKGFFYGDNFNLRFASPYANSPIQVPASLIGSPQIASKDSITAEDLNDYISKHPAFFDKLHESFLLFGTAWRWVTIDQAKAEVAMVIFRDDAIMDVFYDPITKIPSEVHLDFSVMLPDPPNPNRQVRRRQVITREDITIWDDGVKQTPQKNILGTLPISFAYDAPEGEHSGRSVFARILPSMEILSGIVERQGETLTKFRPKLTLELAKTAPAQWLLQNGYKKDGSDVNVLQDDFFLLTAGDKLEILDLPATSLDAYDKAIDRTSRSCIIGSGVPEIYWPSVVVGNHASTESQTVLGAQFIEKRRRELTDPYMQLFYDLLKAFSTLNGKTYSTDFEIVWQDKTMESKLAQSQTLSNFASAMSTLSQSGMTNWKMIKFFIDNQYPNLPEMSEEVLKKSFTDFIKEHTHVVSASPLTDEVETLNLSEKAEIHGSQNHEERTGKSNWDEEDINEKNKRAL